MKGKCLLSQNTPSRENSISSKINFCDCWFEEDKSVHNRKSSLQIKQKSTSADEIKKSDLDQHREDNQVLNNDQQRIGLDDFVWCNKIGQGAFGTVFRVRKKDTNNIYAIKQISKKQIIDHKLQIHTLLEKHVLLTSKNPFIIELKFSFQTKTRLYFVMEYISGGEIYEILKQNQFLPENVVRFVAAEVILALEYLHIKLNQNIQVIYRDLKPENILLNCNGHIKLIDFGLSTLKRENSDKNYTLAGTPEYLAPEIITREGHSYEVDLWTLGILIFEMLCGYAPFTDPDGNVQKITSKILQNKVQYPMQISNDAKDLICQLLKTNPNERLGVKGYHELKKHPFFDKIDWNDLFQLKMKSPLHQYAENNSIKNLNKKHILLNIPQSPSHLQHIEFVQFSQ